MNSKYGLLCLMVVTTQHSIAHCAEFIPLGYLTSGDSLSSANAIAPDGSVAGVLSTTSSAYPVNSAIWTDVIGLQPVFDTSNDSVANGLSNGASTAVGWYRPNAIDQWAMIWHPATGYSRLPGFAENSWSSATDVSGDGSIVVGSSGEAFRWTEATGPIGLGDLPGGYQGSDATAISANGKVIVGSSGAVIETEAFRWTQDEGMVGLGTLSPTDYWSSAENVSDDGSVIVGTANAADGSERAFRWTPETGMKALGTLAGHEYGNGASAVSGDGKLIVGVARDFTSSEAAFVWDQANGMRNLQYVLISDYGLASSLAGWTLTSAADISSDGLTIVGGGYNPDRNLEAWLVRLDHPLTVPEPTSFFATAASLIATMRRIRRFQFANAVANI